MKALTDLNNELKRQNDLIINLNKKSELNENKINKLEIIITDSEKKTNDEINSNFIKSKG